MEGGLVNTLKVKTIIWSATSFGINLIRDSMFTMYVSSTEHWEIENSDHESLLQTSL